MKNKMKVIGEIKVAGVYVIRTTESIVKYVGSSLECNDALSRHLYYLKRGLYAETNKAELQKLYDLGVLEFEVIHISAHNPKVKDMSVAEKENLHEALSVLEQFHIELNKDTIVNKQNTVKRHSSNKNELSTLKRRKANLGSNNPCAKYSEELIQNIIWLKENTELRNKEIEEIIEENTGVLIKAGYICTIGRVQWIHIAPIQPIWYN